MTDKDMQNVAPNMREQAAAVSRIEETMRAKVLEQVPIFEKMPAAQKMKTTQGEVVLKANPAAQEIRAMFRDYISIVKAQQEIFDWRSSPATVTTINTIRAKLKIAK